MGPEGGYCFFTLSDREVWMDKPGWDKYRFGKLVISSETFTHLKATIEKLCGEKKCQKEVQDSFKQLNRGLAELKAGNESKPPEKLK